MFLYNVTIKVKAEIHTDWLEWLKTEHIPDVMSSDCFSSSKVLRLMEVDDSEGPTFAVQYVAESKALYNRYIDMFAAEMRKRSYEKWGDGFIAFRSVMEVIH